MKMTYFIIPLLPFLSVPSTWAYQQVRVSKRFRYNQAIYVANKKLFIHKIPSPLSPRRGGLGGGGGYGETMRVLFSKIGRLLGPKFRYIKYTKYTKLCEAEGAYEISHVTGNLKSRACFALKH